MLGWDEETLSCLSVDESGADDKPRRVVIEEDLKPERFTNFARKVSDLSGVACTCSDQILYCLFQGCISTCHLEDF